MATPPKQARLPLNFDKGKGLNPYETYVLDRLIEGLDFNQIAQRLNIRRGHISVHLHRAKNKLGAKTGYQAVWMYKETRDGKGTEQTGDSENRIPSRLSQANPWRTLVGFRPLERPKESNGGE